MSSKRHLRRRQCGEKHQFADVQGAQGLLRHLQATKAANGDHGRISVYRCHFGAHFPVGHPPHRVHQAQEMALVGGREGPCPGQDGEGQMRLEVDPQYRFALQPGECPLPKPLPHCPHCGGQIIGGPCLQCGREPHPRSTLPLVRDGWEPKPFQGER